VWETVGKVALLAFLAVAILTIVVVFIRKARANGIPDSQVPSMYGRLGARMPPTPLPDWVTGDDDPDPDEPHSRQESPNR
jgi:hypothetical protein